MSEPQNKIAIYVTDQDRERVAQLQETLRASLGINTTSGAMRYAVMAALRELGALHAGDMQ